MVAEPQYQSQKIWIRPFSRCRNYCSASIGPNYNLSNDQITITTTFAITRKKCLCPHTPENPPTKPSSPVHTSSEVIPTSKATTPTLQTTKSSYQDSSTLVETFDSQLGHNKTTDPVPSFVVPQSNEPYDYQWRDSPHRLVIPLTEENLHRLEMNPCRKDELWYPRAWNDGEQSQLCQTATSYTFEGEGSSAKDAVPLTKKNCERLGITYEEGFAIGGTGRAKREADSVPIILSPKRVRLGPQGK